jgi:general nucleoside transport system permease protein
MGGVASALTIVVHASFWTTAIAIATPLLFAAIGALICGQVGILSFNIEGIFTAGALAAFLMAHAGDGHWPALAVAAVVGAAIGLLSGALISPLQLPPRTSGLAVSLFFVAMCHSIFALSFSADTAAPRVTPFAAIDLSWIERMPFVSAIANIHYINQIGQAIFHAAPPAYLSLMLLPATAYVMYRTPVGMALRACGRNPDAIIAQGRSAHGLRIGACVAGATLIAIGGATLALTGSGVFSFSETSGRGFAALTLALIAGWRIGRTFFAVLGFAMIDAFQAQLQHSLGPSHAMMLLPLLPYAVTIIVLVATSRASARVLPLLAD